jgi:hypothetical protein
VRGHGTALANGTGVLPRQVLATMSLEEAAAFLYPPVSRDQLGRIVAQLPGLRPVAHRPTGGKPLPLYDAVEIMDLHSELRRWL